jgi:Dolichyl-phosphate-mannose-protein mannosyltransferase
MPRTVARIRVRACARTLGRSLRLKRARRAGRPAPRRAGLRIPRDRVSVALAALLGVGLFLRVWFLLVWSPAITGYSDSGIYFTGAVSSLWSDPIRTVGYSMFLRVLHGITPHLIFVVIVQHALGLVTALLYFLAVRRCGGPRGLGLAPAAIIALGGDQLFLEHAALSDALFIFLLGAMLYCTVRASQGRAWWAALAGLCAGLGVWDREVGLAMMAVIALWLVFSAGRPTRRTLAVGALSLVVSLATVGIYVEWRQAASGLSGLTSNGAWNLYGRVAPWANCAKFTPPPGTRGLCEATPPSRRGYPLPESKKPRSSEYYIYNSESPAYRLFGPAYLVSKNPHATELLQKWSEAAILGQPLEYLHAVWLDTIRLFDPNHHSYGDFSADEMIAFMLGGFPSNSGKNEFVEYWQQRLYPHDRAPHRGDIGPLKEWERITRTDGVWMGILLALCLAGPWLLAGAPRSGMILFALSALALLFFPILAKGYDYRFVIPAFAPLLAAGALAAWGLAVRLRPKLRAARS